MLRQRSAFALVAAVASLSLFFPNQSSAQDGKPKWISDAETALVGTWQDTSDGSDAMPGLEILINKDKLKVRVVDPESDDDSYDQLYVLKGPDGENDGSANAFASIVTEFGDMHLMLSLQGEDLGVDAVKIIKDSSGWPNQIVSSSFIKVSDQELDDAKRRATSPGKESAAKKPSRKKAAKIGRISGEIATRSTLRGTIRLTPTDKDAQLPEKIRPADGLIKVSGANPRFDFTRLPSGKYDLHFEGTINGSSRAVDWKGIETDPADSSPSLSLSLRPSDDN
jgi:hypothetical protein